MKAKHFDTSYNAELSLVDSLYEFHPAFFTILTAAEREALSRYYLYDVSPTPSNIFLYRAQLLENPDGMLVEADARRALKKLRRVAGIT